MSGDPRKKLLFICTHNSARSHMAEGLVNALFAHRYRAWSAGTEPSRVHPLAIKALAEIGIDISRHTSKGLDEFLKRDFDVVITVCDHANEVCPFFPGGRERLHRGFEDPSAVGGSEHEKLAAFVRVRDEIKAWLEETFVP